MSKIQNNGSVKLKIRQSGVAAIEAAIVLPILLFTLSVPIYYARCFWHYTVAQKAAQDAARYLSKVPSVEMRSKNMAKNAGSIALQIAQQEISELSPGSVIDPPVIQCNDLPCGNLIGKVPSTVRVFITFSVMDNIFGVVTIGRYGLVVTADVTMPYVGN